jgi:hypothetical protein
MGLVGVAVIDLFRLSLSLPWTNKHEFPSEYYEYLIEYLINKFLINNS